MQDLRLGLETNLALGHPIHLLFLPSYEFRMTSPKWVIVQRRIREKNTTKYHGCCCILYTKKHNRWFLMDSYFSINLEFWCEIIARTAQGNEVSFRFVSNSITHMLVSKRETYLRKIHFWNPISLNYRVNFFS